MDYYKYLEIDDDEVLSYKEIVLIQENRSGASEYKTAIYTKDKVYYSKLTFGVIKGRLR